jgi:hypothetical protein
MDSYFNYLSKARAVLFNAPCIQHITRSPLVITNGNQIPQLIGIIFCSGICFGVFVVSDVIFPSLNVKSCSYIQQILLVYIYADKLGTASIARQFLTLFSVKIISLRTCSLSATHDRSMYGEAVQPSVTSQSRLPRLNTSR